MKIKNNIYWIGELNPLLRKFDIVMETQWGTSYNSYLIKDELGDVIVDTVHERFCDSFINKINEISNVNNIKYLIVSHCEPDHSGSIATLLKLNPNIQIFCSFTSEKFLKDITNLNNLNIHVVTNNEELKLKNHTFKFFLAPNLHWPDTMFTYLENEKMLFTCDFLGSHFCEPRIFDYNISYPQKYSEALEHYYYAIMSPFKRFILKGLEIVNSLNPEYVLNSHGPILTKNHYLPIVLKKYDELTNKKSELVVPVFYVSAYQFTEQLALSIVEGIKECNFKPLLINLETFDFNQAIEIINNSSKFFIGSPTINRKALPIMINLIANIDLINANGKSCLVFGSYGWTGEAKDQLISLLKSFRIMTSDLSFNVKFKPTKDDLIKAKSNAIKFLKENC